MYNIHKLLELRKQKDEYFKTEGPLTEEQRIGFAGLSYFPTNEELVFQNVAIEPFEKQEVVEIQTSVGDTEPHKKVGEIHFSVKGTPCELTVYQDMDGLHYFLPFKDTTSGKETYGAGRYLDIEVKDGKVLALDFNFAYNPYCAYNYNWRCPITPLENSLKVPILAGEKF